MARGLLFSCHYRHDQPQLAYLGAITPQTYLDVCQLLTGSITTGRALINFKTSNINSIAHKEVTHVYHTTA